MSGTTGLVLSAYNAAQARAIVHERLIPVWEDVYSAVAAEDPFFSTSRFLARFDGYASAPGFTLYTAARDSESHLLGMAFGYTLQPGGRWWRGLRTSQPTGFTDEDGRRTFAVNEIMVVEPERRHGVATALHRELLSARPERRATLLVEPDNVPARQAYLSWGWRTVGVLQPYPDSPTYEAMVVDLPLTAER